MSDYTKKDLNKEIKWFESKIAKFLNSDAKITRVCIYYK